MVGSASALFTIMKVSSSPNKIFKTSYRNRKKSITIGASNCWNKTQHKFSNLELTTYSPNKIKSLLTTKCIENY